MKSLGSLVLRSTTIIPDGKQATLLELLINRNVWDSLSKVDQSIIKTACQAAMLDSFANQKLFRQMRSVEMMKEVLRIERGHKNCSIFMRRHGMSL